MLKFTESQTHPKKKFFIFLFIIFANFQLNASIFDEPKSLNPSPFEGCKNPNFPELDIHYESGSVDAGKIDIESNGDLKLNEDVLIGLDEGIIKASSASYLHNHCLLYTSPSPRD